LQGASVTRSCHTFLPTPHKVKLRRFLNVKNFSNEKKE